MKKIKLFLIIFLAGLILTGWAWECGKAPPTKRPQRRKAGEGFPPLPLPVTPLRRTEKKNPPAPPVLVGKVICGPDNKWTRAENDIENLLKIVAKQTGITYRAIKINLSGFSFNPEEIPILYITGVEPYKPEKYKEKLKEYLEKGGFIWANASSGSSEFTKEFTSFLSEIFPERNLYKIYPNHPLKLCFYNLNDLKILDNGKEKNSDLNLRILNIGCRAAVILSPYDLGCGWAMHTHPWGKRYIPEDAIKIGVNMAVYSLTWIDYAKLYDITPVYVEKTKKVEGKIYVGQIIHSGDWDPHPAAMGKLLKLFAQQAKTSVYLETIPVDLKKDNLKNIPVLYITGHFNPSFSKKELEKLRNFLLSGGTIIADSCCGSQEFTSSFRTIISKIVPEASKIIPGENHPVYQFPNKINITNKLFQKTPLLEIYTLNNFPAIIFSPYGIGGEWEGIPRPFTTQIPENMAKSLGVNILVYLLTH